MSAFFSTFVANAPDDDGDISLDTELTVTNDTDQCIHQIQFKIWFRDDNEFTLGETDGYEDVYLAPGNSHTFSPWGRINQRELSSGSIGVRGLGSLARRDFRLLGEIPIPAAGESRRLTADLSLSWNAKPIKILVARSTLDGDGDFRLEFKALIENTSNQFLKVVTLKAQLIDAEGVEIQNDETEREIPAGTGTFFESNFYNVNSSQLEGAKAIFSLKALIPVDVFDITETAGIENN